MGVTLPAKSNSQLANRLVPPDSRSARKRTHSPLALAPRKEVKVVVRAALSNYVINEKTFTKIGPAINAGTSLFLYGPPGNGKTSIARGIGRMVLGEDLYIPYAVDIDGQVIKVFDNVNHEIVADDDRLLDEQARAAYQQTATSEALHIPTLVLHDIALQRRIIRISAGDTGGPPAPRAPPCTSPRACGGTTARRG